MGNRRKWLCDRRSWLGLLAVVFLSSGLQGCEWFKKTEDSSQKEVAAEGNTSEEPAGAEEVGPGNEVAGEAAPEGESQAQPTEAVGDGESAAESVQSGTAAGAFTLPEGLSWETNDTDAVWSDPQAQKGGVYKSFLGDYPATFRQVGPNSNSSFRGYLDDSSLGLLTVHPNTGNLIPLLATHWAVAPDHKTVYYKLDMRARWSDDKPVVAEDYLFTIEFMRSPHINAPWYNNYYTEEVAAVNVHAPDVISVVAGKKHTKKILLQKTSIRPTPRHFHKLNEKWVQDYNWKVPPNTGAYQLSSHKNGQFVRFSRKTDWWAKDLKYIKNLYNFDHIHLKVILDKEARWQHFVKGEVYDHGLIAAEYWYTKAQGEVFDKGYVTKLWAYTDTSNGTSGLYINQSRAPFNDQNVRYALAHAMNFSAVNESLMRGEYQRLESFYVGFDGYEDNTIRARRFDPEKSDGYMKKSRYTRNAKGFWEKDGKALEVGIVYWHDKDTNTLVLLQEEAKRAGFNIVLHKKDNTAGYKAIMERGYDLAFVGYSVVGNLPPPSYWEFFHSKNAKVQTNNLTMTNDAELDKLIDTYRDTFDEAKKKEFSRQILQKIHADGAFIPRFLVPFDRRAYWSFLKLPQVPGTKRGGLRQFLYTAWIDEKAQKELEKKQKEGVAYQSADPVIDTTYKKVVAPTP